jgi:hypothetical protein
MMASVGALLQLTEGELKELTAWLKIRDFILCENQLKGFADPEWKKPLALACDCTHPDAIWLTGIVANRSLVDLAKLLKESDDARALCFYAVLFEPNIHMGLLRRSAERGYAFAQVRLAQTLDSVSAKTERAFWLDKALAQGERDAFYYKARLLDEVDRAKAAEHFFVAASLGHGFAAFAFGERFARDDPRLYFWMGKAVERGVGIIVFFGHVEKELKSDDCSISVRVAIGRTFKGTTKHREHFYKVFIYFVSCFEFNHKFFQFHVCGKNIFNSSLIKREY